MNDKINSMTAGELLAVFNKLTGSQVKRFADRASGLKRLLKAAEGKEAQLNALIGLAGTTIAVVPADQPIPSVGEAFAQMPEVQAAGTAEPAPAPKAKRQRKAKAAAEAGPAELTKLMNAPLKRKAKAPRAAKGAATPMTLTKPIEGSKLVVARGRVVRPENAKAVLAGKSLWGSVSAAPSERDQLKGENSRLNLNYPAKKEIKPMREGTKRHKLVTVMRGKGVTIEDVMAMFGLTHDQAVYKLRDLHYMTGHGLEMKNGRVFVTDRG